MPEPDRELDLFFEQVVEGRVSRRQLIRRLGAAGLTMSSAGTLLAACGGVKGTNKSGPTKKVATHAKVAIKQLNFSNWPLYIDKSVLKDFEKQYPGSHVKYTEEINDNEEFFGKVRQQLQRGDSLDRDLVALTDWMAARWVKAGWVEPKDKRNIPNEKNLTPTLRHPLWDPNRDFSLPWQSGTTALGYNPAKTGRTLHSIGDLFDPKFKGKVTMLSDPHDSAGLMVLLAGKKTEDATLDDVLAGIQKIDQENKKGQIRRFTGNDYTTDLAKGNVWVAVAYSGDIVQLQKQNPNLQFLIPDEGAVSFTDNMMMPQKPPHPYAAETMMNYVYDPKVAAKIAAAVNYVTPVDGAKAEAEKIDPKLASNQLIFPSAATRAKVHPYVNLTASEERVMNDAMQKVIGA
ncbi:MAG: spermidine/putrescine transport system substrate-binding protein [Thermoleophilaceae bacterium]|jgi:spermidine/putrescine transport system substrate-binding protein|nr:spermidine/putrescine transport system substrate-binding protein [Thermoleophilaceae bacterium]